MAAAQRAGDRADASHVCLPTERTRPGAGGRRTALADTISDELISELAAHLEAVDPDADMTLDVTCSACGARSEAVFDVAVYLWTEIEAEALRLLRDVHCLARGYGWGEADILALSPFRRRAYLELVQT